MSEDERLEKEKHLMQAWCEMSKRQTESSQTSKRPANEAPLDLKTKPKSQQSTNTYDNERMNILEDKILHNIPIAYVPPNIYIENNYYEPISPPEPTDVTDSVEPNITINETTSTVQERIIEEQIKEYHIVTHDQYLEYVTLRKNNQKSHDETTEGIQDTTESESENNDIQQNNSSSREKRMQELIGMSDEYKNYIFNILNKVKTSNISRNIMTISLLAKFRMIQRQNSLELIKEMGEQRVNAAVATNPEQEDVFIVNEEVNDIPANVPNEIHNNRLLNVGNVRQSRMMNADLNAIHFPNVPYVSQAPPKNCLQNEQEATQTNHTIFARDQQQFLPHTYSNQQQSFPHTFVPSSTGFSGPHRDRHQVNSIFPKQRWDNPDNAADKHQTYPQKVIPSGPIQTYTENDINPIIQIRQQKGPNPVILSDQQHIEKKSSISRIRYPDRIVLNNQQQILPNPVESSSQYSKPTALNYNERFFSSNQQQSYPEGIVPTSFERGSRKSRQQRPYHEQPIPGQHQIYSNVGSQSIAQIRCPDSFAIKNPQQIFTKQIETRPLQQRYHGFVPPESPQRYPVPTSEHSRHYNLSVLNSQPHRHPIPPAPYAPHQAYLVTTSSSTIQKMQPKRQYQRRKGTTQRLSASLRRQYTHSSPPVQPQPIQQYTVPPQMIKQTMQPLIVPEVPNQTIHPVPEQVPEYYQQYYNQNPENPHVYKHQNYHHSNNNA